jgi:hypothetical protein
MKRTLHLLLLTLVFTMAGTANAQQPKRPGALAQKTVPPIQRAVTRFSPLDFRQAAAVEKANPPQNGSEIDEIEVPQPPPNMRKGVPIAASSASRAHALAAPLSGTGPSPGPSRTFKAEFLSGTSIPPDTMGAVGSTHIVAVTNDRMRIFNRDGVELSRMTLTAFWAGVTIKGATIAAFDPKVFFDRFNNRFILVASGNGQGVNSGAMFAVSQTADPTGLWNRYSVAADPASTAAGGHWIDYPSVGHNKNWIVIDENVFNFGTAGGGFFGTQIYVLDKQAAYSNTLSSINLFQGDFNATCLSSATPETEVACGFTMAPAITEDNTTDTEYMVEDWDNVAGQLRLSKLTGTPSAPLITVGTQFPQSPNSWQFNAARITTAGTQSGGYLPQRQLAANLTSGTRIMANDSRIQNSVLRNGKLWTTHTVMLASTPTAAGTGFSAANPDNHSGIQWWQIDPTIETGLSTAPLQRGRIEDATADNCHDGAGATKTAAPCSNSVLNQHGEFFAFPNITVNQSEDVLIGFSRFSGLTYPNSSYAIRRSSDPVNTMRDPIIYRPGQANYNIGGGSGAARQNRWGDYSSAQTDPLNDTDFWAVQEYAGTQRNDFLAPSYAGPWETWWALVKPTNAAPTAGTAIISEFRLRGPQGVRDEYVKVYNPGATPIIVETTDGSDGWALAFSPNGTTITGVAVIPNGTVIPPHGSFLITDNPDNTAGGTSALTYSLNATPSIAVRNADSDTGWAFDLADNGGVAMFNTANTANFAAGTRLDSAGFAPIAAGLFKEGAGIPAITATTPTGQMTFHRILTTGVPQDTGANENDFQFVDPALENLTVQSKLGAAGPQNLDSPLNSPGATFPSAVLDGAVSATTSPNTLRVPTPAVPNGAFGTITFSRTFTNNTGADLKRLRFRVVDITTAIAAGPFADLRPTSISAGSVFLSGGGTLNVTGSTLETPPTQTLGGGYNSTISAASIALATPLLAGASLNLQFSAAVNVEGNYNFCLIPEGDTVTASAPLCFSGSTLDTPPSITPGAPVARNAGVAGSSATIATVSDIDQAPGTLVVTPISVPTGITITGIVNSAGTVTATIGALCTAAPGANNITLQVADSAGEVATATFVVNVSNPTVTAPTASNTGPYCAGGTISLSTPLVAGAIYAWTGPTGFTSALQNPTRTNAAVADGGIYSVTITVNGCTSPAGTTTVTVNPLPPTPTITPGGPTTFCTGGSVTLTSSSATGNQWYLTGNPIGGATSNTYVATASGSYTVTVTDVNSCTSAPSAATVVTVNSIPATPTITPGGPTTFCAGGSVTLTSSSASGKQWSLNGNPIGGATSNTYVATAGGSYTVIVTTSGCSSAASAATAVTVNPIPPTPTITPGGPTTFCAGGSVTLTSSSASGNQWFLNGNPIGGATSNTYVATAAGSYTVTVTASSCTSAASAATVVTVNPNPNATITAPASVNTTSTGNLASVANAGVGATYSWTPTNAVITAGAGTPSITFTAGAVGTMSLQVTVTTAAGCSDTKSVNINVVVPAVTVTSVSPTGGTIAGGSAVTINGTGFNAGATVTFGGSAATNVVVVSSIKITARTPAHAAGSVNVVVTNTDTSNGTLTNGYLYKPQQFDPNNDGTISAMDIFYLVNYLYMGGPPPAGAAGMLSGDANGDGVVNPLDIFYLVNYLFLGGPRPNSIVDGSVTAMAIGTEAPQLSGSIALGKAVLRNGHYFVPVIMTAGRGSVAPQAMSLRVHLDGDAGNVTIRKAGAAKDLAVAFETDRFAGNDLSYLVSYGNLVLGTSASAVVAEIEIETGNVLLSIDPQLTMLSNQAGTITASVTNGKLKVTGTKIESGSTPLPRTPGHEVN